MVIQVTGSMLKAGRALAGLLQDDVAARAGISCNCLKKWEASSDAVPHARAIPLARVVSVLESEGITFLSNGVQRVQPAQRPATIESIGVVVP